MGHLTTLWVLWLSLCPLSFLGTRGAHRGKSHRHSTLCGGAVTLFLSNKGAWKAGERAGFEATHSAHLRTLLEDLAEIPLPPLFCFILFHLSISSSSFLFHPASWSLDILAAISCCYSSTSLPCLYSLRGSFLERFHQWRPVSFHSVLSDGTRDLGCSCGLWFLSTL